MLLSLLVANGISKSKSNWASNCGDINESNRIIKGNCTSVINSVSKSNGNCKCNVSKSKSNPKSNGPSKSKGSCKCNSISKSNRVMKSNSQSKCYVVSKSHGKCNAKSNFVALTCLLLIGTILNSKL